MFLPDGKILILFDGYCHLCSRTVQVILKFDKKRKFVFAPLSSTTGIHFKEKYHITKQTDSVILIKANVCNIKSEAVLEIADSLGGLFKLLLIFRIIPRKWRDKLYDCVARNRFRWFGKRSSCLMPPKGQEQQFL